MSRPAAAATVLTGHGVFGSDSCRVPRERRPAGYRVGTPVTHPEGLPGQVRPVQEVADRTANNADPSPIAVRVVDCSTFRLRLNFMAPWSGVMMLKGHPPAVRSLNTSR